MMMAVETDLRQEILKLKEKKNATILAHYYQETAIQDIADDIGDSFYLAQQAAKTQSDIIVFAGVSFMAETAKILNPEKKVLIPDTAAGCSLADSCSPTAFADFIGQHPDHLVVTYINCSAEVKAMSDVVCTSSNALKIINAIPRDQPIIFAPDENLGKHLMHETGRDLLLWDGVCSVHEAFALDKIIELCEDHPMAKIIAHPECDQRLLKVAHFIGSTKALLDYVVHDASMEYIIATEAGVLHQMKKAVPHKTLVPAPVLEDNTCACSECAFMKLNTLEKVHYCLLNETPEVTIPGEIASKAVIPLQKMLAY